MLGLNLLILGEICPSSLGCESMMEGGHVSLDILDPLGRL